MIRFISIIAALFAAASANAATWYVDPAGSDLNPGTSGSPFLRLNTAFTACNPGDTIIVQGGLLPNSATTQKAGTEALPITVKCEGGGKIIFLEVNHAWHIFDECFFTLELRFNWGAEDCVVEDSIINPSPNTERTNIAMQHGDYGNRPRRITIRRNQLLNAGYKKGAISFQGRDHVAEDNYFSSQIGADAILLHSSNTIIRGNEFRQWSNLSGDAQYHTDLIQAFGHNGEISQNNLIENNYFVDCAVCQIGNWQDNKDNGNVGDWTFRNNVWDRVEAIVSTYIPRVKFYNNVFYKSGINSGSPVFLRGTRGQAIDYHFYNNIFMECGRYPDRVTGGSWGANYTELPVPNISHGNNLIIGRAGTAGFNKTEWVTGTDNITGLDPQFVAPVNAANVFGFRLQSTSPLIGAAQEFNALFTTDFDGTTRGAEWDIGAFEYEVGSEPSDVTAPTLSSAAINGTGEIMSLIFDEPVQNVSAAHYSLPGYTLTLDTVNGAIVTFSLSPIVQSGANKLLGYTSGAGRTSDIAGNLLATFSNFTVVNGSVEAAPDPPRAGRRGRGSNIVPAGR